MLSSSPWGCELKYRTVMFRGRRDGVILFVRMWVEIRTLYGRRVSYTGHPLREDVSWNAAQRGGQSSYTVILFVRMWVEIYPWKNSTTTVTNVILFVRMWVEISFSRYAVPTQPVILFVRMWVEILFLFRLYLQKSSSSSWGCELKLQNSFLQTELNRHPLREDVSWNNRTRECIRGTASSSSWGCELK